MRNTHMLRITNPFCLQICQLRLLKASGVVEPGKVLFIGEKKVTDTDTEIDVPTKAPKTLCRV